MASDRKAVFRQAVFRQREVFSATDISKMHIVDCIVDVECGRVLVAACGYSLREAWATRASTQQRKCRYCFRAISNITTLGSFKDVHDGK